MAFLIDQLLTDMLEKNGSDLHLIVGLPPKIRVSGELEPLDYDPVSSDLMEQMLSEICSERRWQAFLENKDLDFAHEIPGLARFRCNYLYNYYGMGAVLRQIPSKILSLEDLNLPKVLRDVCELKSGLVCVTGPTGSGKSTTMAAMIDYINKRYAKHIVTVEDPVEFVHQNNQAVIVHREVGEHTQSFGDALRGAMRADPDIILLGEMRELETIKLALSCASMGMLVFGTLHTNNAPKTIDRIIDAFPADEQPQIRIMLAECLTGVVSQLLCKKKNGGRVAVHEILLRTSGLANVVREGQISSIRSIIESNGEMGMCSMDNTLRELLNNGTITPKEAYLKAADKKEFAQFLPSDSGVNIS
jgi:twitching motility protein PilT